MINPDERLCATPDCHPDPRDQGFVTRDHLGVFRRFCDAHGKELTGVRERIPALLQQIEGLKRVLDLDLESNISYSYRKEIHKQGALLLELLGRERVLTGADTKAG